MLEVVVTVSLFGLWTLEGTRPGWGWLWLVLLVGGAACLVLTYRGIFQRSERRLTWGLMALRGAGLLALFLALAKPTWTKEADEVEPGRLAVVLDTSRSMSLADSSGQSRYDLARAAVDRLKSHFEAKRSGPRVAVELFGIDGRPLSAAPDQPTADRTDLVRAVTGAVSRLHSRPLTGVVLVSDGVDNTGRQEFSELTATPVPVHGIGFPRDLDASTLDLAVRDPVAPTRAMVNNGVRVSVPVLKKGGPPVDATVHIRRGTDEFASRPVSFGPGDGEQTVVLEATPREAGDFVFTASVEAATAERYLANNAAHFPLRVDKEKIKVLYLEGFLRFEFKYLKAHLEEDPDVKVESVVRQANPDRSPGRPGRGPLTPDRLKGYDLLILGDMEANYLSPAEYHAIATWLEDKKHHALLVLGGYRSFGPGGFGATPLAGLLPVDFANAPPFQSEEPFVLQPTERGLGHPVFEISTDRVRNQALWAAAPPLRGASLVRGAKPGAEVLAVDPSARAGGEPAVVVAVQRYGGGHTMVVTADTTWLWSRLPRIAGQADTLYGRFWSQTTRWLAGRDADDYRPLLAVSTDKPAYEAGKRVNVRIVRQPRPDRDVSTAEVKAEARGADGKAVPVHVRASSAEPDVFVGSFYPPSGGRYQVSATLTAGGAPLANQAAEFLVSGKDLELADADTKEESLRAIARATGGQYFTIREVDQLADAIVPSDRHVRVRHAREFWNSPLLFFVFLGAVTVEWVVRRKNHLA